LKVSTKFIVAYPLVATVTLWLIYPNNVPLLLATSVTANVYPIGLGTVIEKRSLKVAFAV